MITEIACIAVGIPVGYVLRNKPVVVHLTDKITAWSIYALLFLLGLSLGANDELVSRMADLGVRAVVISLCSLMGSVAAAWVLQRLLPRNAFSSERQTTPGASHEG